MIRSLKYIFLYINIIWSVLDAYNDTSTYRDLIEVVISSEVVSNLAFICHKDSVDLCNDTLVWVKRPYQIFNFAQNRLELTMNSKINLLVFLVQTKDIEEIFRHLFVSQRNVILFLSIITANEVSIITQKLFREYFFVNLAFLCINTSTIIRYNPFSDALKESRDISLVFEDFTENIYGYPLKVGSYWFKWKRYDFDTLMGMEIVKQLNATAVLVPPGYGGLGFRMKNGTYNGQLQQAMSRMIHVGFTSRFVELRNYFLVDNTYVHDVVDIRIILPIRNHIFKNIVLVMPLTVWLVTLLVLTLLSLYLTLSVHQPIMVSLLTSIRLLTGGWINVKPIKHLRILLVAVMFFCFVIDNYFQTRLISVLTVPMHEPSLETLREASDSSLTFMSENILRYPLSILESPDQKTLTNIKAKNQFVSTSKFLKMISECSTNNGFIGSKEMVLIYGEEITEKKYHTEKCFYPLKESLGSIFMSFIVPKGSPLLGRINAIIMRISQAGLPGYWDKSNMVLLEDTEIAFHFNENVSCK
ncbi:hypothetical protein GWI33_016672 [Rhynchophorus ferrugineus]|uniref:Ionotropic receptor n=1 Tax=Rhynchophorus ferrugineus TaxID=354439 RepID=A0A834M6W7_RHYFE|nr:hypothetical protein GWI33_016672 [Rhynchophorus ferrugineus]